MIEIYVSFDGVDETDRYFVSFIKDKQICVTLSDSAFDCFYNRFPIFVDFVIVRKISGSNEKLKKLTSNSSGKQTVGYELDNKIFALKFLNYYKKSIYR